MKLPSLGLENGIRHSSMEYDIINVAVAFAIVMLFAHWRLQRTVTRVMSETCKAGVH